MHKIVSAVSVEFFYNIRVQYMEAEDIHSTETCSQEEDHNKNIRKKH